MSSGTSYKEVLSHLLSVSALFFASGVLSVVLANEPVGQPAALQAQDSTSEQTPYSELYQHIPSALNDSTHYQIVSESPGWITVVTAEEIRRFGYRTLIDVLDSVPGFYAANDRNYPSIGVRGFGPPNDFSTRLLLMLDGVRLNDGGLLDTAPIGRHFLVDVSLVDRIEISRGPSSSVYGNNAMTAVINVITKRGRDYDGVELEGSFGDQTTVEAKATYGKKTETGPEYLASFSVYDSAGNDELYYAEFDTPEFNNGFAEDRDGESDGNIAFKYGQSGFTLSGAFSRRRKDDPTGGFGAHFNSADNYQEDSAYYLNLNFASRLGKKTSLSADVYAQRQDFEFVRDVDVSEFNLTESGFLRANETSVVEWFGAQTQLKYAHSVRHNLLFGFDTQLDTRQDRKDFDDIGVFFDDQRSSWNWGVYLQDRYSPHDDVQLFLGARFDQFEGDVNYTSPRLGIVYNPSTTTTLKLLYSSAFRAPNTYDKYQPGPEPLSVVRSDPDPEQIATYDLIVEHQFNYQWSGVVNLFHNELSDLITGTVDEVTNQVSVDNAEGEFKTTGIDLAVNGVFADRVSTKAGLTLQDSDDIDGDTPINSPSILGKVGLYAPLIPDTLFGALDVRYVSEVESHLDNTIDAHYVVNLTLSAPDVFKGLDLSGSLYNLFDEKYSHAVSPGYLQDRIEQDGRRVVIRVRWQL